MSGDTGSNGRGVAPLRLLRGTDLASIRFEFENLRPSRDGRRLERIDPQAPAFVVAHLPPQHLAEQSYEAETAALPPAPPVPSRLSGPSRLAFRLRDGVSSIEFSLQALLDWRGGGALLQSRIAETRSAEEIAAGGPAPLETAVEAPYRLFLSPDPGCDWLSHASPRTADSADGGRTEIWHARLVGNDDGPAGGGRVRAVWSPDYANGAAEGARDPFDTPLRPHYTDLIDRTHRTDLYPQPIRATNLALSALGAWLDLDGPARPGPDAVKLEHWTQRTAFGQDTLCVTEDRGFLLPTGHRASLVEVTERVFSSHEDAAATGDRSSGAYLRHRRFIRIATPVVDYERDWRLPFVSLRLLDLATPPLRNADASAPFWVETADPAARFLFRGRVTDWAGAESDLEFAAMFVPGDARPDAVADAAKTYEADPAHVLDMGGQSMTVTASADPATRPNACVEVLDLAMSVRERASADRPAGAAPFSPIAGDMRLRLPLLREFVPEEDNAGRFRLTDAAAADNPSGIFLERPDADDPPISLDFGGGRIGSLILPNMGVAGVSLTHGPFGDAGALSGGALEPHTYFIPEGVHEALLLGSLSLAELIAPGGTDAAALPGLTLAATTDHGADGRALTLRWQTSALQKHDDDVLRFRPGPDASLKLEAVARSGPGGESGFTTVAELNDYVLGLQVFPGMGVELCFDRTRYRAGPGRPPEYDLGLTDIRMTGLILQVVEFLARSSAVSLQEKKEGSGLAFSVTVKHDRLEFEGAWAGSDEDNPKFPEKDKEIIAYGPFWFYNVGVSLKATIFFERKPVEFKFALASPAKPFMITSAAGIWGGAGSFAITLDTHGLVKLAFSIAAGAVRAIEIGGAKGRIMATVGLLVTYEVADKSVGYAIIVTVSGGVKITKAIKVSVSFVLELKPVDKEAFHGFKGEATVSIKLKIAFFSFAFSFCFEMFIPGPSAHGDRSLAQAGAPCGFDTVMSLEDWTTYRGAFAR